MSMADEERPPDALETAMWCNVCFLPSAMRFATTSIDPVTREKTVSGSYIFCFDCQHHLDEEGFPLD